MQEVTLKERFNFYQYKNYYYYYNSTFPDAAEICIMIMQYFSMFQSILSFTRFARSF